MGAVGAIQQVVEWVEMIWQVDLACDFIKLDYQIFLKLQKTNIISSLITRALCGNISPPGLNFTFNLLIQVCELPLFFCITEIA